jgi:hypothetical protein
MAVIDPETLGSAEAVKAAYLAQVNTPPPADEPTTFRRVVDTSAGPVTVEGDSMEELLDNVAALASHVETTEVAAVKTAQTEAERRAAEQATADSEFVLAQKFMSNPSQATAEALGFSDIASARAALAKLRQSEGEASANQQAEEYVAAHSDESKPDFYWPTPVNGQRVQALMRTYGLSCDAKNISRCVEELRSQGLLLSKPAAEVSEADLYKMPLEDLRKAAGGAPKADVPNTGWDF